ncbi:aromatic amino acid aminotransferase II [Suhomyces tanzawaensis NRRL Y-17324]|uniref:Aromatic amino acid aminotransferase II n=1 Tax=Suhomyces tanzawaensis NRRL Y-17324 TaxID=984487 RepID=A0A1E4SBZ5_9ASCO|nr:aromatic amino acid aminotransferase II [Suhomyces tanzawaensis NRRL Y-17324]ODV76986.1 aromatic amino acid aminotransferase II [Suhomyces tanzawaensis NRRL Y-17324]
MANYISKHSLARLVGHFTQNDLSGAPEGFKPHPKPVYLSFGVPNSGFFPIESIHATVKDYPFEQNAGSSSVANSNGTTNGTTNGDHKSLKETNESFITTPAHTDDPKLIDIARGLQYSEVNGLTPLLNFTREFITRTHKPGYEDWSTILTSGASDGLLKAADVLLDPEDVILIEEVTFSPFLSSVKHFGGISVPVKLNIHNGSDGIDLEYLLDLLENWETLKPNLRRPKALYTIATGQNPTALTQTLGFRKKVYALAEKYDFAIIEDDPYGYLTLKPYEKPAKEADLQNLPTVEDYLKNELTPSYVTLDTSGRVIRVETFSKLFAPGLRLGFIVAHKNVIDAISKYATLVTRSPSGAAQIVVNNTIQLKFGGLEGWLEWIVKMKATYSHRKNVLLQSIYESEAFEKKYVDVIDSKAGMFAVAKVNFPEGTDVPAKIRLLHFKFINYGVNVVPVVSMTVDKEFSKDKANFFRLSFAPASNDEELAEGGRRLASAIYDFFEKGLEY